MGALPEVLGSDHRSLAAEGQVLWEGVFGCAAWSAEWHTGGVDSADECYTRQRVSHQQSRRTVDVLWVGAHHRRERRQRR